MILFNKNPEYFLTVVSEGSISRAAEKLYISQPYLSRHIIRLEESLDVQLLDRKTPLCLTPAGEVYVNYLESYRQLCQKLALDLDAIKANREQTLRLGFSNWRASTLLPDILPEFSERYPNVKLEFFEVPTSELYRLVEENKVDLVIMNAALTEIPDYATSETILYEKILLVGNSRNAVTKYFLQQKREKKPPDLHLLEQERTILLRPELMLARRINNFLDKQQVLLRNFVYTTNAATALNLTAQNYGFCFLNEAGIRCAPNLQELAFFDLQSDDMIHPLCVVYRKKDYLRPIARSFITLTKEFYEKQRAELQQAE